LSTREKIIKESAILFNAKGFGAINLLEIANTIGISRGNLTYYFKDKEAILEAIADKMWTNIEVERMKSRQFPSFKNIHNEMQLYYKFQREYAFIFTDPHVLNHQHIKRKFREMTHQTILDIKNSIMFSINIGNIKKEEIPGSYNNIAFITWMISFFWHSQKLITGEKNKNDGEKLVWTMMMPHFTEKGIQSFKKYFGETYFKNLGEPFEMDIEKLITF
jgi:hypothetical protein